MIWFIIALGVGYWFFKKTKKNNKKPQYHQPNIKLSFEVVRPDPELWAREREARKMEKANRVSKLVTSFVRPSSFSDALTGILNAIKEFADSLQVSPIEIENLSTDCLDENNKKTEQKIRKKMNEAYKQREENSKLIEALLLCVVHAKFVAENPNSEYKVEPSLRRILNNLKDEKYRSRCIGFLYLYCDLVKNSCPEVASFCESQIEGLFSSAYADIEAKKVYEENLANLSKVANTSDKHFMLNSIVEYLVKRRRYDADAREKLIKYCEEDISLYKPFLADFSSLGGKKKTFAAAVKSSNYFCPSLPSFNALWDLYEEENNLKELKRLHQISEEIKYGAFEDPSSSSLDHDEPTVELTESTTGDPCLVEVVEIVKSGKKGKQAFLDSKGNACSTEEAVVDHFESLGYKVLRGEVQFWQAMFALSLWEEIFDGTGTPNELNDIPIDLFAGQDFYLNRKNKIEGKYSKLQSLDLHEFITGQLGKYGGIWTRIVHSGARGDFSYKEFLESADFLMFLKTINSSVFAKVVYRIAKDPNENRAGTPDYVIWKNSEVSFIEVKGIREKVRESQFAWLSWMNEEKIPVKIIRVKGKNQKQVSAA